MPDLRSFRTIMGRQVCAAWALWRARGMTDRAFRDRGLATWQQLQAAE